MASDRKLIKKFGKIADKILALEPEMAKLEDGDFLIKTQEFKEFLSKEENTLEDILIDAYALVREAARRILGLNAYRVQLIGAIILHFGDIAEMKTGEGKTLTGLFSAYLNALTGKGVHIVTVNEYLSERDSEIMKPVYALLGLTVGLNSSNLLKFQKRNAYSDDITYTTNSELGFDYLKDNMVVNFEDKVQRGLNYVIIDEADSILIDESRTPLIISGGQASRMNLYLQSNEFVKTLKENEDIDIDLETKEVYLNESGMEKANKFFSLKNLFAIENVEIFHLIMNSLKAHFTFKEGVEYTVKDGEILLIDQFTGRIMEGRAYSGGLQQAIQSKENVEIEEETTTVATITYQNFYRLYAKISGMTGTAKTEEEEFIQIYNTRVIVTPTNKTIIRKDDADYTFAFKNAALKQLMKDIKEVNDRGNPILLGTTTVESSEQVARYLEKANFSFEMINAKNHHREADIIAKAGQKKAITLATNMAGRGTDIKLTDEVRHLGGLYVFGIERNEARRIDNQLRGRAGRQGDPGFSRFYISMEDPMLIRFTKPNFREKFASWGDDFIKSRIFTRQITGAQKKLEGMNFDQRKNVLDYDNILAQQREAMYAQRDEILKSENLKNIILRFQRTTAFNILNKNSKLIHNQPTIQVKKVITEIDGKFIPHNKLKEFDFHNKTKQDSAFMIANMMQDYYKLRVIDIPDDVILKTEREIIIESFDRYWTKHIELADKLKTGVYLQQYAQNNPLSVYVEQATDAYNDMKVKIAEEVSNKILEISLGDNSESNEVQITDKDIEYILSKNNLSKENLNITDINDMFDNLEKVHENDEYKLSEIKIERNILLGLIHQLEEKENMEILHLLSIFGLETIEGITFQQIEEITQRAVDKIDIEDEEKVNNLKLARAYLLNILAKKIQEQIKTDNIKLDK